MIKCQLPILALSNNNNRGNTVDTQQRRIMAGLKKAHKEADQLRDMAQAALERMAAEHDHNRNNSFWAAISIFSLLLMILAGSGAALMFGG